MKVYCQDVRIEDLLQWSKKAAGILQTGFNMASVISSVVSC